MCDDHRDGGSDPTQRVKGSWYFDKAGQPISFNKWIELSCVDPTYHQVACDVLADGTRISTVWLGLNHNLQLGRPLIFETMVFSQRPELSERYCWRYSTLAEAEAGHAAALAECLALLTPHEPPK